jgi:CBS-domain-containing membrane protein
LNPDHARRGQLLYPLVEADRRLAGAITRHHLQEILHNCGAAAGSLAAAAPKDPVVAYAGEPLRVVVYRMAETGFTRLPVLEDKVSRKLVGMISLHDLLRARTRSLEEEGRRERVLRIRSPFRASSRISANPKT